MVELHSPEALRSGLDSKLPPEFLYETLTGLIAQYIDLFITDPSSPTPEENIIQHLLAVNHRFREVTLLLLCDFFSLRREPDGSLSENPFEFLKYSRRLYQSAMTFDGRYHPGTNFIPFEDNVKKLPFHRPGDGSRNILYNYFFLGLGEYRLALAVEYNGIPGAERFFKKSSDGFLSAMDIPSGRTALYVNVRERGKDRVVFFNLVSELLKYSTKLEILRAVWVESVALCADIEVSPCPTLNCHTI
ncbi:hypothetical protein JAAARDRAFT_57331 [Jaapia argillacea MUCL 33604]|uniref:Uncharacterized protein n=1 Tax=Jaapia argillacea MUCL 33604 TaxID=933084 RepID=A0A067PX16_9AGAM|nr:hypothetical protein JAAARDRAFT_57331 [Jaapia argillacea MUCL 33604]